MTLRHRSLVGAALLAGLAMIDTTTHAAAAPPRLAESSTRQCWSPWRPKLRCTHVTVAAMRRHARKRRNVRARQSKRSAA